MIDPQIPAEAARLLALLNSRGVGFEADADLLSEAASASKLVRLYTGKKSRDLPDRATVSQMKRARGAVLSLVVGRADQQAAAWKALNELAAEVNFHFVFTPPGSVSLKPSKDSVAGEILRDVAALLQAGRLDRLKLCADEACGAAFYDHTRSKTQRWHSFATCGNKNNVASHRARSTTSKEVEETASPNGDASL